jgi:hypothetical protein
MIGLLCFVLAILASPFKSKLRLEAENAVLRHQLIVVRRRLPGPVRLTNRDRWFLIQLYRWFPSIQVLTINATAAQLFDMLARMSTSVSIAGFACCICRCALRRYRPDAESGS